MAGKSSAHDAGRAAKNSPLPTNSRRSLQGKCRDCRISSAGLSLKKRLHLKDYQDLIRSGKKLYSTYYLIYLKPHDRTLIKTAVKKKAGPAVFRNYEKRVMRAVLNGLTFQKNWLLLAIHLKKSVLTFEQKKELLTRTLRPLLKVSL